MRTTRENRHEPVHGDEEHGRHGYGEPLPARPAGARRRGRGGRAGGPGHRRDRDRRPAATPPGLSCETGKHAIDDYTGFALCRNNGSQTQVFWVHLVCGWSPDVDGERVTLRPGQSGQSTAHCGSLGTGIGEIQVRP